MENNVTSLKLMLLIFRVLEFTKAQFKIFHLNLFNYKLMNSIPPLAKASSFI